MTSWQLVTEILGRDRQLWKQRSGSGTAHKQAGGHDGRNAKVASAVKKKF
jgi:hypothetical protein